MVGWIDGWVDGRIDGRMDGILNKHKNLVDVNCLLESFIERVHMEE